jgi:hypothetical protein
MYSKNVDFFIDTGKKKQTLTYNFLYLVGQNYKMADSGIIFIINSEVFAHSTTIRYFVYIYF